jgi:hypothetical protein
MATFIVVALALAFLGLIGAFLYKVFSTADKVHRKFSLWLNK